MTQTVHLPVGNESLEKLLMWRDPRASGLILAAATGLYLIVLGNISTAWLLSTLSLIVVVGSQAWSKAAPMLKRSGPPVPSIFHTGVSEVDAHKFADSVRKPLNDALATVGLVLTGKSGRLSTLVTSGLLLATWLFRYISFPTLAYVVVVTAFTVPKLYEANKDKVDRVLSQLQSKSKDAYAQFGEKVRAHVPSQPKKTQ